MYRRQEKAKGNRNDGEFGGRVGLPPNDSDTLKQLGVSKQQSSTWQKLADASDKQFETALNKKPRQGFTGRG